MRFTQGVLIVVGMLMNKEFLWIDVPELDAQIRSIERPMKEGECYVAQFGLFESAGEHGLIYTELYDKEPTVQELKKDLVNIVASEVEGLKEREGSIHDSLSADEEEYLEIAKSKGLIK